MDTIEPEVLDRGDMVRLAGGHDAALNALMDRHAPAVFQFLYRMLGSEEEAHDLAQETFVRVYQNCSRFKPEMKFTTWLYTIAGNLARNHYRWCARHPQVSLQTPLANSDLSLGDTLPAATSAPDEAAGAAECSAAVRAAVQGLPVDLREALILCEWEDQTVAEAAAVLQCTPKAVEARLYRARNILREKLRRWLSS